MTRGPTRSSTLLAALLFTSCSLRKVPDHLRVDPTGPDTSVAPPASLTEAVAQLVDTDPLVRRPTTRTADWWLHAPDSAPIVAWLDTVGPSGATATALDTLETTWPHTVAIPLARGARLAELEVALPTAPVDESGDRALVLWLGTFTVKPRPGPSDVRAPLGWLAEDRPQQRQGLVHLSERAVLAGWLASPTIPVEPVARAMATGRYDRLRSRPEGALILGRAAGHSAPDQHEAGTAHLNTATHLALVQAAADGPRARKQAQDLAQDLATARGLEDGANPLPGLLDDARVAFTANAGDPTSVGLALVATAAQRLDGACPDAPCVGVDRVSMLRQATQWGAGVEPPAWAWRLVAAKDALDQLTVSIEEKLPSHAFPLIADIIVGETHNRVPLSLLLQRSVGPEAALAITRGFGRPDGTRPEDALAALQAQVDDLCKARPDALPEAWLEPVDQICH